MLGARTYASLTVACEQFSFLTRRAGEKEENKMRETDDKKPKKKDQTMYASYQIMSSSTSMKISTVSSSDDIAIQIQLDEMKEADR